VITLSVTNIPLGLLAKLTGQYFDEATGIFNEYGGVPPYFALMFRSLKTNGSYRYYCYPKCKFDVPDEAATTKGETPDPKMMEITVHAIKTTCKFDLGGVGEGLISRKADEDVAAFDPSGWFTAVPVPEVFVESV